jgi:hypothetical protein
MSFHSVVAACLHPGTAAKEKGKSVRIDLKKDETVLLFRTDSNEAKAYLGIKTASDFVYFYMKDQHTPKLVFVELKGSDLAKAAEQLQATIGAVRDLLAKRVGALAKSLRVDAVVVFSGSAPKSLDDVQRQFRKVTGVSLRTQRESLDIRAFIAE